MGALFSEADKSRLIEVATTYFLVQALILLIFIEGMGLSGGKILLMKKTAHRQNLSPEVRIIYFFHVYS